MKFFISARFSYFELCGLAFIFNKAIHDDSFWWALASVPLFLLSVYLQETYAKEFQK